MQVQISSIFVSSRRIALVVGVVTTYVLVVDDNVIPYYCCSLDCDRQQTCAQYSTLFALGSELSSRLQCKIFTFFMQPLFIRLQRSHNSSQTSSIFNSLLHDRYQTILIQRTIVQDVVIFNRILHLTHAET
jgi:hypothetical protein